MDPQRITASTLAPPAGTVIIRDGLTGTVYQRFYTDGLFHCVTGSEPVRFDYFLKRAVEHPAMVGDFIILMGVE